MGSHEKKMHPVYMSSLSMILNLNLGYHSLVIVIVKKEMYEKYVG